MRATERIAKSACEVPRQGCARKGASTSRIARLATLLSLLHIKGGAAPSSSTVVRRRCLALPVALLVTLVTVLAMLAVAAPAFAECSTCKPWWHLLSRVQPAKIAPGGEGTVVVQAVNLGDAATGPGAALHDVLPAGLTVAEGAGVPLIEFHAFSFGRGNESHDIGPGSFNEGVKAAHLCTVLAQSVTCSTPTLETFERVAKEGEEAGSFFELPGILHALEHINPYEDIEMRIRVKAASGATSAANATEVSGGGAPAVSANRTLSVQSGEPAFGAEDFKIVPEEAGGGIDTRAGSHPFQLTTTLTLNQTSDPLRPPALPRNLHFNLPPGLIGNAAALPQCSDSDFRHVGLGGFADLCPEDTAIGVSAITIDEPEFLGLRTIPVPLFNLVPEHGEPARFGFEVVGTPVTLDTAVRTGSDYGVTVSVSNITQLATFLSTTATFWGVPGDPAHDASRGWGCLAGETYSSEAEQPCTPSPKSKPVPFLTLATSCAAPFDPSVDGLSWPNKADLSGIPFAAVPYTLTDSFSQTLGITACNQLSFSPFVEVKPDVQSASTPSGLAVHVRVPQEVNENGAGLASSNVKDIAVTFPEGVTVNPAAADGLQACSEAQIGFTGFAKLNPVTEPGNETAQFTPGEPSCPDAAKIGTVTVTSPLLPKGQFVQGALYLATPAPNGEPGHNPFNSLIATYIVAKDPISGVRLTLPGEVSLDPVTGRITSTFKNNPQLAFEDAEIHLFGGSRAPFSTPARCGTYTTEAAFTPWSANPAVGSQSSFDVTSGPNGTACPGTLPFAPSLAAGTTNINAAAFSTLNTTISRVDGNQNINRVQLHMPPGLSGILAGVPLCPEAQANAGTCGQESLIGKTVVSVGLGNEPFSVTGGQVFLTEKYQGAPFGLSIVNPAVAGPFDLGKVIVRAKIEVDPTTAALTITTGEIPHILKGIPLQIKHVSVAIDRPGFTFNPTNCNPQAITGTIGSTEGATAPVSVPFQVTNCASLKFTPTVATVTAGKASKPNGASLHFKIAYPKGALGTQSWFNEAKFTLPKQLPARLTTIQKACDSAIFEHNRPACPAGSKIGTAIVHTPVLPVPLAGPVYFVSYGGAAFPDAVLVLDGYGVHIELHGNTLIEKGVTSATFRNTPDVPFESIEVTLPTGPFSEFGANLPHNSYNFCGQKLVMPTLLKAQNGLEIHQNTPVGVTGCPPSVSITKTAVKGNSVAVTVKLGQQGTLKITGRGLRTTTKRGLKAGTRVINVPLTAVGRAAKSRHGKLKVQAALTVSGRTGTATATLRA
jgi:hypothetical protein